RERGARPSRCCASAGRCAGRLGRSSRSLASPKELPPVSDPTESATCSDRAIPCLRCGKTDGHKPWCEQCSHCAATVDEIVLRGHRPACPEYVPGAGETALNAVYQAVTSYVVWPSEAAAVAFALWIAATHAQPAWHHASRFVLKSPIKRCGKTRAQE